MISILGTKILSGNRKMICCCWYFLSRLGAMDLRIRAFWVGSGSRLSAWFDPDPVPGFLHDPDPDCLHGPLQIRIQFKHLKTDPYPKSFRNLCQWIFFSISIDENKGRIFMILKKCKGCFLRSHPVFFGSIFGGFPRGLKPDPVNILPDPQPRMGGSYFVIEQSA